MLLLEGLQGPVDFLQFSPDGATLLSAGTYGTGVRLWDLTSGKLRGILQPKQHRDPVRSLLLSPDGTRLVVGNVLWDLQAREILCRLEELPTGPRLLFSPDSQTLAGLPETNLETLRGHSWPVMKWDARTGQPPTPSELIRIKSGRDVLAFSPDGHTLATASSRGADIGLYDLATGTEIIAVSSESCTSKKGRYLLGNKAAFSPDLKSLAILRTEATLRMPIWSGNETSRVFLYDVATAQQRVTLSGHRMNITSLAFSPDSRTLATASLDGLVKFWDVTTGKEFAGFDWRLGRLYSVAIAPDGMRAAVGGKNQVIIWDVDS